MLSVAERLKPWEMRPPGSWRDGILEKLPPLDPMVGEGFRLFAITLVWEAKVEANGGSVEGLAIDHPRDVEMVEKTEIRIAAKVRGKPYRPPFNRRTFAPRQPGLSAG
jgi:hypothetical protein